MCIAIKNRRREPGRDVKILTDRMLHIKGSAEHFRCTCYVPIDLHALPINNYTTTCRRENAFENRRLPASACLFSLQPGVALSRTVLRTTDIPVVQTFTPPWNNFKHGVLSLLLNKDILVRVLNSHRDKKT